MDCTSFFSWFTGPTVGEPETSEEEKIAETIYIRLKASKVQLTPQYRSLRLQLPTKV